MYPLSQEARSHFPISQFHLWEQGKKVSEWLGRLEYQVAGGCFSTPRVPALTLWAAFFFFFFKQQQQQSHLPVKRKNSHQTHKTRGGKFSQRSENTEKESSSIEPEQHRLSLICWRATGSRKEIWRAISQNVITINFNGKEFCYFHSPNW